jgi:hypothetical protein
MVLGLAPLRQGNCVYLVAWEKEEPLGHVFLALIDPPELEDAQVALLASVGVWPRP